MYPAARGGDRVALAWAPQGSPTPCARNIAGNSIGSMNKGNEFRSGFARRCDGQPNRPRPTTMTP
jgi:hypothetical protein